MQPQAISGCTSTTNLQGPSASHHIKHHASISPLFLSGVSSKLTELSPTHFRSEKVVYNNIQTAFYPPAEKSSMNWDLKIP